MPSLRDVRPHMRPLFYLKTLQLGRAGKIVSRVARYIITFTLLLVTNEVLSGASTMFNLHVALVAMF